jgi:predicted transcriptional regulator
MSTIPLEERVFRALAAAADEAGEVTIGLAELAVAAGRTRTQRHKVRPAVRALEERGLVRRTAAGGGRGRRPKYQLLAKATNGGG